MITYNVKKDAYDILDTELLDLGAITATYNLIVPGVNKGTALIEYTVGQQPLITIQEDSNFDDTEGAGTGIMIYEHSINNTLTIENRTGGNVKVLISRKF